MKPKQKRSWTSTALFVFLLALLGTAWYFRYAIQDWYKLRGYTPPGAVVQLANDDGMAPYTRHLFYLNKPQLPTTVAAFRSQCPENEDNIVLGCYHPGENGIAVYAIQDSTLNGIQQVTAAHEVLHAVYERLSSSDRKTLNDELESFYLGGLTDQTVKDEIAIYQKTEPNDVDNEMSCTFGTEVANLPPGLERYYAKYFSNRGKIVGYYQQYQTQFTSRKKQIADYDARLSSMKSQIDSLQTSLTAQGKTLQSQKAELQQLLNSGDKTSYNAGVDSYNAQVQSYNAGVDSLRQKIAAYNQLVDTRNSVAGQLTTLAQAIDTRVPSAQ